VIRYTTNGTEPNASSTLYTSPVLVNTTTTLKAKGFKTDWSESDTVTATYTMSFGQAAAPTMNPGAGSYIYRLGERRSLLGDLRGDPPLHDGRNGADGKLDGLRFPHQPHTATTTLKAKSFHPDYTASTTTTAVYTIKVVAPQVSPSAGTYSAGTAITLTSSDGAATIRYTVNGADPTASDTPIASGGNLHLMASFTLRARSFKTGCDPSDVVTVAYTATGSLGAGTVGAGSRHSFARNNSGTVWGWGQNGNGQIGDGTTTTPRTLPVLISGLTSINGVSGGENHSMHLKSTGVAMASGLNTNGQIGDGTTTQRNSPVQVSTLSSLSAATSGPSANHGLAVDSDGGVFGWGTNTNGELGDGTTTQRLTPVPVLGLKGVVAIDAGASHSLALRTDGATTRVVWAWGDNQGAGSVSLLGDGTTTDRTRAIKLRLSGVVAISAYHSQSLVLQEAGADRAIVGWGVVDSRTGSPSRPMPQTL
jgi:hypothetical protein